MPAVLHMLEPFGIVVMCLLFAYVGAIWDSCDVPAVLHMLVPFGIVVMCLHVTVCYCQQVELSMLLFVTASR